MTAIEMRRMTDFERTLHQTVEHNSLLFLEEGVQRLIGGTENCEMDDMVLACTNIQIALELAMRAYILRNKGLRFILARKQQELENEHELEKLYMENKLKVIEFDSMKNLLKGKDASVFKKEDFQIIEDFQMYRNKLVHFCCPLDKNEKWNLREKLMYYVVRVVLCQLYDNYEDKRPAEYFEELLGWDFYRTLINDKGYIRAIQQLAKEQSKDVGLCPICGRIAYSIEDEFCYFCNVQPLEDEWGRTECIACGRKNSVIYDKMNIHLGGNHHSMPGLCQHCESHPQIFECPICGQTYWQFSDKEDWMCYDGHCTTQGVDYKD